MKTKIFLFITASILISLACSPKTETEQVYSDNIIHIDNPGNTKEGTLEIMLSEEDGKGINAFNDSITTKSTLPDIDMTRDIFKITASCSDGTSFKLTTKLSSIQILGMPVGAWTIRVESINKDKISIAYGRGNVEIKESETSALTVDVTPYAGFGVMEVTVNWEADIVNPVLKGSLSQTGGPSYDLNFDIAGKSATTVVTGASGYYLLRLNLYDSAGTMYSYIGGAVEIIRIIEDETTPGVYTILANSEYGYGDVQIGINVDMKNPIEISLTGQTASLNEGQTMTIAAISPLETGNVNYTWYLNGEHVAEGNSFTTRADLHAGNYRMDVTAFNDAGDRGGSVSYLFMVQTVQISPPANLSYSQNPTVYTVGIPITANTASVTGSGITFSVSPALPAGLTLNTQTGTISGTPTTAQSATIYTVYATNSGGSTSVNLSITIMPLNDAPIAIAGIDRIIDASSIVQFDGSGSYDPDGDVLTYNWVQIEGISVVLLNPNSVNPSFTAPSNLSDNEELTFQLTVSDGELISAADSINVTVRALFSIWNSSAVPAVPFNANSSSIEVGNKFRTTVDGYVTALKFYRGATNPGTIFVGHLWSAGGTLLAEAAFATGTPAGWQQVNLSVPVPIISNTTYIVSYHSSTGYAVSRSYFTVANQAAYTGPVIYALTDGVNGYNGVYGAGAAAVFPTNGTQSTNYWVDVMFRE